MRRTNLYLTSKQYEDEHKRAKYKEINFSEMFRKIVDYYLENKK